MAKASTAVSDEKRRLEEQHRDDYNKVVASAELGAIQLIKLDFVVSPEYYINAEAAKLGYVITPESCDYNEEGGFCACVINFQVDAALEDESLLRCSASYLIMYEISETCEPNAVKAFVERVGVFACYPYFRGVFANLDWAANTHLPPLPVHRETVKRKAKRKSRSKAAKISGAN